MAGTLQRENIGGPATGNKGSLPSERSLRGSSVKQAPFWPRGVLWRTLLSANLVTFHLVTGFFRGVRSGRSGVRSGRSCFHRLFGFFGWRFGGSRCCGCVLVSDVA